MSTMSTVPGSAAQLIDACYAFKLRLCEQWDKALGLSEDHVCSAVRALKICYAMRRPFFVMMDDAYPH
ncbi:hypothetical protein A2765_01325 [Candidatus Kaiserbacteria bacterium RIFCSPHIGHO2_01_FULL_56_24]|uniref:Uncharacterized protein n=1 Tax=Candidatus Kaiserbacteria bacterium RIFCSPHIGHO2_01_FULL_56_24 TaxID=1798487 RepID=A0A1F6DAD9_9BACT|nr:MAG: hypothetical protein A2765_01325 [Candidatus Kaiserbacteria bacterium RIFCSPHIGHO2_01_FULL_56_24]